MAGQHLHFYANDSNDVLVRSDWFSKIDTQLQQGTPDASVLADIAILLAGVPGGANKYSVWSNIKCPKCNREFPYRFKGNLKMRLEDVGVVLVDGCELDSDEGVFAIEVDAVR